MLTVSQVAKLAGVSVRALHHYDELGLLRPSERSDAGYRLYGDGDLERLQQILFFRALEFPLEEIARILADPQFDRRAALVLQRRLLVERSGKLQKLIEAVDAALGSLEKGTAMKREELFEAFGDFDPTEHEDEARERWGNTEAYRESAKRTAKYTKEDWKRFRAESDALTRDFVGALERGVSPDAEEAVALAERHRAQITKWFYPCTPEIHRGLGEMYVSDPRFTANLDKARAGLSEYLRGAFRAAAERHEP